MDLEGAIERKRAEESWSMFTNCASKVIELALTKQKKVNERSATEKKDEKQSMEKTKKLRSTGIENEKEQHKFSGNLVKYKFESRECIMIFTL